MAGGEFLPKAVKSAPSGWHCRLMLSCIPKNGMPVRFEWTLALGGPVDYWSQFYYFTSPISVVAEAQRSRGCVIVVISVSSSISVPCSRCLEPAFCDVLGKLRYVLALRSSHKWSRVGRSAERDRCEEDDLILIDSWENEEELAPLVWEALIMSLPSTVLCKEGCKGLCPQCGANLNVRDCGCFSPKGDPRFAVLASLKQN